MLGLCFPVSFVCRFAGRDGVRGAGTFGRRAGECRFFSYLCTKPRVAAVIIHVVQTADFCLYTSPIAILDVCGGKNVDFSRNVFQMRRNLPGFLAISGFLRFFFAPGLSRTS